MQHADWLKEMERSIKTRRATTRIAGFLALAKKSREHAKDAVSGWHEQQALVMAAHAAATSGDLTRGAEYYEQLAQLHRAELVYHGQAIVCALVEAALLRFRLDQSKAANILAREALRVFGDYTTNEPLIEQLLREMRNHAG